MALQKQLRIEKYKIFIIQDGSTSKYVILLIYPNDSHELTQLYRVVISKSMFVNVLIYMFTRIRQIDALAQATAFRIQHVILAHRLIRPKCGRVPQNLLAPSVAANAQCQQQEHRETGGTDDNRLVFYGHGEREKWSMLWSCGIHYIDTRLRTNSTS